MKRILFIGAFGILIFLSACKKNQLGGKSIIRGVVSHHSKVIPNSIVYIKFNAKEFPGTDVSQYDSQFKTDADGKYQFNCYKGDYYLYGLGYDPGVPGNVSGGIPVHIRNNEKVDIDVPVTE
jgi:hypothetical protein